jgi:anti-sigma regulatory factor (Ser/Thr protein kinase)
MGHRARASPGFEHEAIFYGDLEQFAAATGTFVEEGLADGQPVMVALPPARLEALRDHLGPLAPQVRFVDMAELGRNPARLIPAWRRFVDEHPEAAAPRAVAEPVWAARAADELDECYRHEALLNVAFAAGRPFRLMCPYDAASLGDDVLDQVRRSHPKLVEAGCRRPSPSFDPWPDVFAGTLDEPTVVAGEACFDASSLGEMRARVSGWAASVLPSPMAGDLTLAAHEMAVNCVVHGGGGGCLRYWRQGTAAVVELSSEGCFEDPLVGRVAPDPEGEGGRGMWLANQLCDLVQLRSSPRGSVVRLRLAP